MSVHQMEQIFRLEERVEALQLRVDAQGSRINGLIETNAALRAEVSTIRAVGKRLTNVLRGQSVTAREHNLLIVADETFFSRVGWRRCVGLTSRPLDEPVSAADAQAAVSP